MMSSVYHTFAKACIAAKFPNPDHSLQRNRLTYRLGQMPRYYFDLHNDMDALDPEGKELSGIEEAKEQALVEARAMLESSAGHGRIDLNHFIQVRDHSGKIVHRLHFGDVVTIIPRNGEPDPELAPANNR